MKFLGIISTSFVLFTTLHAQNETKPLPHKINDGLILNLNKDAISFYRTTTGFFESPFNFDSHDFILSGIIMSATALSFALDNPVRNSVNKIRSSSLDNLTGIGEKFGRAKYGAMLSSAFFLGGYIFNDNEQKETGLMVAEAIFLNGIVTEGLKILFGRSRPFSNEGNFDIDFLGMELDDEDNSLPSGHTSTAFAIATVLSERLNNTYASIALYSLAGLTAFQRIYDDRHWVSDTILGAALGTIVGLKVIQLNSEDESGNPDAVQMNFIPVVNNGIYGAGIILNF
jgi:membrane-associated phospholipid phosphatase